MKRKRYGYKILHTLLHAYLQDSYTYGDFKATLQSLNSALGEMYEVKEKLDFTVLKEYQFMIGMPSFSDTVIVAKDINMTRKLQDINSSKSISYHLALPNGAILLGHRLKASTYQYLEKIKAIKNAQLFPYEVMISKGKAVVLSPKYYLALSLPLLSMTDFLQIASAPKSIIEEIKSVYK